MFSNFSQMRSSSITWINRVRAALVVTTSIVLCASTCSPEGGNEGELARAFVTSYVDDYLAPTSAAFVAGTGELEQAAQACTGQTREAFIDNAFADVAQNYEQAWRQWGALALARFGPYDQAPLRLEPKIGVEVVDEDAVDAAIADNHSAESMREIGANRRGLPAIGYVLHDVMRRESLPSEAFANACSYLVAATADVHFLAEQWETGFLDADTGWARNLTNPGTGAEVDDDIEALTLVLQNIGDALYIAREDGIVAPRGDAPEGDLNLGALLARPSGLTLVRADAVVEAASWLVRQGEDDRVVASTLYATRNENADVEVAAAFDAYWAARATVGDSLEVALETDVDAVNALSDALRGVTTLVLGDIMGRLGLAVAFTDADGD